MEFRICAELRNVRVYSRTLSSQGLRSIFRETSGPYDTLRLFVRKIRRVGFGGLRLHVVAGLHLDERLGCGAVLLVRFQPE